jgi:mRNA interferase MazF
MDRLGTTIVVPLTSRGFPAPFRVAVSFGSGGFALCDRIRTIDRARLRRHAGDVDSSELEAILKTLQAIFAL